LHFPNVSFFRALAKKALLFFLAVEKKINVLFVRLAFIVQMLTF